MRLILTTLASLFFLIAAPAASTQVSLTKFTDSLYICRDEYYARENSMVYVGPNHIN